MSKLSVEKLLPRLKELEELLQFPNVAGHIAKATELAASIARDAPTSVVADLATKVINEATALHHALPPATADRTKLNKALWHLRLGVEEAKVKRMKQ